MYQTQIWKQRNVGLEINNHFFVLSVNFDYSKLHSFQWSSSVCVWCGGAWRCCTESWPPPHQSPSGSVQSQTLNISVGRKSSEWNQEAAHQRTCSETRLVQVSTYFWPLFSYCVQQQHLQQQHHAQLWCYHHHLHLSSPPPPHTFCSH